MTNFLIMVMNGCFCVVNDFFAFYEVPILMIFYEHY